MYVPVFGEERYTIQEIKRARLGATTVDGMQPGREGGAGDRGRCDLRLYKRLLSIQKHVCGHKKIIKKKISVFFYSNVIFLSLMLRPLDIINTSSYDYVYSNLLLGYF